MATKTQIERAKNVDFLQLIESLEIPYKQESGHIKILCIFHQEDTPSCAVYDDHYYCFGCAENGDQIEFIKKVLNCDFNTAVLFLNQI